MDGNLRPECHGAISNGDGIIFFEQFDYLESKLLEKGKTYLFFVYNTQLNYKPYLLFHKKTDTACAHFHNISGIETRIQNFNKVSQ